MHRSGTSWVGNVLGQGTGFIIKDEEIFNPGRFQTSSPIIYSYEIIGRHNEEKYLKYVDSIVANDGCCDLWYTLKNSKSPRDTARYFRAKARSWYRHLILPLNLRGKACNP